ncbi:MAG: hypothetical protein FWF90_02740 [Promicromonosporaceae bacterium]|nr:hypothetical protein [Promicromonosporaceae bacterium]
MNEITLSELEGESMELLPERETLFFNTYWTKTNLASITASNSSLALNAASLFSNASSAAVQTIVVTQS